MDSRKTVLLLTPGAREAAGGIAKIVDYTVRAWPAGSRFRLRVVDTYGTGGILKMPFYFGRAALTVLLALLCANVHVLHINMSERLSVWRKLCFASAGILFGVPVVAHMHGASFAEFFSALPPWRQAIIRRIMRSCATVLVLGSYWRDYAAGTLGIPQEKIRILYNAVPAAPAQERRPAGVCRLVFLGVVGERKGVDTLLHALAHPLLKDAPWQAVIGGNGEVARFAAMAEALGIAGKISFPGLLDEAGVQARLSQADIFVLPSRNEALPVAILEAMSYGCAVVSTPVGSIRDAVIPEETGLLVAVGDHEQLARALARLVASPDLRRRLGAAARTKFQASFALPFYIAELEAVYETVSLREAPPGMQFQT